MRCVFLRQSCPRAIFRGRAGVGGRTFVAIARDRRLVGACFCTFPHAHDARACEFAAVSFSKMCRPRVPTLRLYVFWSFSVAGPFFSLRSSSHRASPPSRLPPPTRSCCPASNPPPSPPRPPPPLSAPQVNSGGMSILHWCMSSCKTATLDVAKLLIEHGADVNAARGAGWCRESSRRCGRCDGFFASELSQGAE